MRILITGATGNVGKAVIEKLVIAAKSKTFRLSTKIAANNDAGGEIQIFAGVRDPQKSQPKFDSKCVTCVKFDFKDVETIQQALDFTSCQVLFLVRPPQLANVPKYFQPMIDEAVARMKTLRHIIFLSVQGADTNRHIPHAKIEKAIIASKMNYTFLRPAYFMQNFLQTPMYDELVVKPEHRVFLPAGNSKFNVIDVSDIGCAAGGVLASICRGEDTYVNKSYDLTNNEQLSFGEMTEILDDELSYTVTYVSPSPLRFFFAMRRRYPQLPLMHIAIMIMLHYLPRFKSEPIPTNADQVMELCASIDGSSSTQQELASFREFVQQHKEELRGSA